jgi:hypothetical protein
MLAYCVAQSVQQLAMGWTVRGSKPGGGEIFSICPHTPWGSPSLLHNGYRVIPRGKAAGAWRYPPASSAEVQGRVKLYLYSPLCLHSRLQGELYCVAYIFKAKYLLNFCIITLNISKQEIIANDILNLSFYLTKTRCLFVTNTCSSMRYW